MNYIKISEINIMNDKKREPIKLSTKIADMIAIMSEGNPGRLRILLELRDPISILGLDDMNIRGWQIWIGYKDYCGSDLEKFRECIRNRDSEMVNTINKSAIRMNLSIRAVIGGASFDR